MRRRLIAIVVFVLLVSIPFSPAIGAPALQLNGEAAILVDMQTGQVLFEKNPDTKMYPASTTKMLTALIVLEKADLGKVVTVSKEASMTDGSAVWLKEGERMTVEDLLYSLLVNSANDAAVALAEEFGGTVDGFVGLMNEKATALGARNSFFTTPHGLPDERHVTTARDLATIARAALEDPRFREMVGTRTHNITRGNPEDLKLLINTNKLLWRYDGCIGVKTGYTSAAKQCLVALAERNGREVLAVVLKSEGNNLWSDATAMLDYGFDNFVNTRIVAAGQQVASLPVPHGTRKLDLGAGSSFDYVVPIDGGIPAVEWRVNADGELEAPIVKGDRVGQLALLMDGKEIRTVDLVALGDVPRERSYWWLWLILAIGGPFIILEIWRAIVRRRRWKKRTGRITLPVNR